MKIFCCIFLSHNDQKVGTTVIPRFKPKAQGTLGHFGTTELMGESGTLKDCPSVPARKGEGREKHRYSGTNQPRVLVGNTKNEKILFFVFVF